MTAPWSGTTGSVCRRRAPTCRRPSTRRPLAGQPRPPRPHRPFRVQHRLLGGERPGLFQGPRLGPRGIEPHRPEPVGAGHLPEGWAVHAPVGPGVPAPGRDRAQRIQAAAGTGDPLHGQGLGPLEYGFWATGSSFDRNTEGMRGISALTGERMHLEPRLTLPLRWPFGFLKASARLPPHRVPFEIRCRAAGRRQPEPGDGHRLR